ncbi:hypothetical protein HYPSUDRAFT_37670 [Hypholoma sublateritium FD-334 SS-4]|uniref:Uncharacterized protein n=1 Tax=Hypholoma sublateritium (strain FD-334 SS-4) TaxID=945553 RepID=A0A0D2MNZ4_HYPSF|nr:hypothetical protein HYPSUDRAFT_37670 [Hypholoma sublateritium FD-334 SS-4]
MAALTLVRAYQHSFDSHPNTTLAFTGGCLNAIGDTMAQLVQNTWGRGDIEKHRQYDFQRTARFFAFGMGISPIMGRWNRFLERRFPLRSLQNTNGVSFAALSKRVACDQLIMAPCGLVIFLGSMGIMERRSPRQIGDRFRDLYRTVLLANWKVWPLAQMINFRYMPLAYRVPFSQSCGMVWTLYLSLLSSGEDTRQDRQLALQREVEGEQEMAES